MNRERLWNWVLVGSLFCLKTTTAFSQADFFQPLLNAPSEVDDLVNDSNGYLFAATRSGIYRSTNSGERWENFSLIGIPVHCLSFNSDRYIFAGISPDTESGGDASFNLCYSDDNGRSWSRTRISHEFRWIQALATNVKGYIFTGTNKGIYRSKDGGKSWIKIKSNDSNVSIETFAFDSFRNIWAIGNSNLGGGHFLYRSIDNGITWTVSTVQENARCLAINSKGHIFLGTSNGVLRSINNGRSWNRKSLPKSNRVESLAIDSQENVFVGLSPSVYGEESGIYCSKDNGENWAQLTKDAVKKLVFDAQNYLFVINEDRGVYRSIHPTTVLRKDEPLVDASCTDEMNAHSEQATFKTSFTIKNQTKMTLIVYWLDYRGNRGESFEITPNEIRQQNTFETHKFLVADSTGKCIRIFEAPAKIVIQ